MSLYTFNRADSELCCDVRRKTKIISINATEVPVIRYQILNVLLILKGIKHT